MIAFQAKDEIFRMLDFILFFVDFRNVSPPVIGADKVDATFWWIFGANAEGTHNFTEKKRELFANGFGRVFTWMIACSLTTDKHHLKFQ